MTISFQTQGGHTYGTLCTVTRVGQKVVKTYGESLGRVVDKERLVFYSRSRGVRGHYLLTHFWTDKVTLTVESGAFS